MSDIYDQHAKAFANVSAYVIMKGADRVATVAFKYPRDGASRLWAYVHWIGTPMVRGYAGGYGYDKHSAACADAARKIAKANGPESVPDGHYWNDHLRKAGFEVWQAV